MIGYGICGCLLYAYLRFRWRGRRARPGDARPRTVLRGLSVCVLSAGRVGTGDCVVASVMLVLWVLITEQY